MHKILSVLLSLATLVSGCLYIIYEHDRGDAFILGAINGVCILLTLAYVGVAWFFTVTFGEVKEALYGGQQADDENDDEIDVLTVQELVEEHTTASPGDCFTVEGELVKIDLTDNLELVDRILLLGKDGTKYYNVFRYLGGSTTLKCIRHNSDDTLQNLSYRIDEETDLKEVPVYTPN